MCERLRTLCRVTVRKEKFRPSHLKLGQSERGILERIR